MKIEITDPSSEASILLIAQSDNHLQALYPPESQHLESIAALKLPNVTFIGGYIESKLVACGALKILHDDISYGEIKRLFVTEQYRGRGYSKQIMANLEQHLVNANITIGRLETGIKQPEALALYRSLGYWVREPFGKYRHDPLSVFMEKHLS